MNKPGMAAKNGLIEKKSRDFQPVSQGEMRYGLDVAAGALTFDLASAAQSERSRDRNGKKCGRVNRPHSAKLLFVGLLFRNAMMMQ
jgi:hypothetical protein